MDPVKTEFKTENIENWKNMITNQNSNGEEDVQKTIKIIYFSKKENQVKQDQNEYIGRVI